MKKTLAIMLVCVMLTACGAETKNGVEGSEQTTVETVAENTTLATTTASATTTAAIEEPKVYSLRSASIDELTSVSKTIEFGGRSIELLTLYDYGTYIGNDNDIYYDPDAFGFDAVRNSSRSLRVEGFDDLDITDEVSSRNYYLTFLLDENNGNERRQLYNIRVSEPMLLLNGYCSDHDKIQVLDFTMGYYVVDELTVNAFIRRSNSDESLDVIIDPAYMYGLPVFSSKTEDMTFDINGYKVTADTLLFSCGAYDASLTDLLGPDYIYAEVALQDCMVKYSHSNGYDCYGFVKSVKPITTDIEKVMTTAYSIDQNAGKDPEMDAVYDAIIGNIESFYTDTTLGITLLDLDFDQIPEILVSNEKSGNAETSLGLGQVDVDIYRIDGGSLKKIDTLHHNLMTQGGGEANILGLKTLPDGTKAWYSLSCKNRETGEAENTDYLFTLDGDSLSFTEIFRAAKDGYYYMGEKIVPTEKTSVNDSDSDEPRYEWNGYTSYFEDAEDLFMMCHSDYGQDMKESTFSLMSDWLYTPDVNQETHSAVRLSKREVSYCVAYLVDAFYLGEYDLSKSYYRYDYYMGNAMKPVIYLYPEEETTISVDISFKNSGNLTCTYPKYNDGWRITAKPDGTLFDRSGNEYYCLYWEGVYTTAFDNSKGFCVAGNDTAEFLREKLLYIGLSAREANEFIIYWLPILEKNPYNQITFHTEDYNEAVPMTISEKPDSLIRVFMTYSALEKPIDIPEQDLPRYERNGFTVVEWGGGER